MESVVEPLFLTPLIRAGKIDTARNEARVGILPGGIVRESYSGFITLNEEFKTNTFFWFFPAKKNVDTAPVLLWLEGGCGMSFFISSFTQTGPFKVKPDGDALEYFEPEVDWTQDYSVIYVEVPTDAGYSFSENPSGYSSTSEHAAEGVYEFLNQFFQIFPEFLKNPFHITAFSFGGHFAAPLADLILKKNADQSVETRLNLKSLILFGPWLDSVSQSVDFGPYLYNVGLITEEDKDHFDKEALNISNFVAQGKPAEATETLNRLITLAGCYFFRNTGFISYLSVLEDRAKLDDMLALLELTNGNTAFAKAIHVGDVPHSLDTAVKRKFSADYSTSVTPYIEEILNQDIPILMVSGQMDIRVNHLGIQRMISQLDWNKSSEFKEATRKQWKVKDELAGYVKTGGGLTYAMMRNAGHMMIKDQMAWSLDLVRRAINNLPV